MWKRIVNIPSTRSVALFITLGLLMAGGVREARAQVVDRMLAIVEGRVVTMGDVEEYRALAAFFNEEGLPDDDEEVLRLLIERVLVRAQVARIPGIRASDQDVGEYLARFSLTEETKFPLSSDILRQAARERIENGTYFNIRFPQEATDTEIQDYYENVWIPEAKARNLTPLFSLEEVRDLVETLVVTEKMQREAAQWAQTLIERSLVEVVE